MADEHNQEFPIWAYDDFLSGNSSSDWEDEEGEDEDDRMDVFNADEMDLVSYFDYSNPGPLVFPTPHDNAVRAFVESVNNGAAAMSPEGLEGVLNGLVQGAGVDAESLFVRFGPGDMDCGRCLVLRGIVHTNAFQIVKVFVHGSDTKFTHAIFNVENLIGDGTEVPATDCYYLDLKPVENGWVDGFLKCYLSFLPADGSITIHDHKTPLYDTLSGQPINIIPSSQIVPALPQLPLPITPNVSSLDVAESTAAQENHSRVRRTDEQPRAVAKTGLAAQRERAHLMTLEELSTYFHLTIEQAAKELNLCSTAVKHICRRLGIARWPGRKVISVNKQLVKLERMTAKKHGAELERILEQIHSLNDYKRIIYETGVPPY